MSDLYGLKAHEIYHRQFGICQLVYVAVSRCWVGLNEKKEPLTAPDKDGFPELDRLQSARYVYQEWLTYLQILDPSYQGDEVIPAPVRRDSA